MMLGGDHSIPIPGVKALADHTDGQVGYLHIDAHHDTADEINGERNTMVSPARRTLDHPNVDPKNVVLFGIRGAANNPDVIDAAITGTISRTIITHGCTQIMVLSMFLFGGPTLHYFALALTVGILFGIYSSVFVAAALAMWLGVKREDLLKDKKERHDPSDPNAGAQV